MSDATKELIDALRRIASIENKYNCGDWDEITEAREIAEIEIAKHEAEFEFPQPDADGWIPWKGGECPVSFDAVVEVRCRDGHRAKMKAQIFRWVHAGQVGNYVYFEESDDIIAYRIVTT